MYTGGREVEAMFNGVNNQDFLKCFCAVGRENRRDEGARGSRVAESGGMEVWEEL